MFLQEFARNRFKGGATPQSQTARDGKGPWKDGNEAPSSSLQAGKERGVKIILLSLSSFCLCPVERTS